jgi:hypothetical protein
MGTRGALRHPAFENFVFFNTKPEKSTFSGLFSYSIYVKVDITPPLLFKNLPA